MEKNDVHGFLLQLDEGTRVQTQAPSRSYCSPEKGSDICKNKILYEDAK